MCLTLAFWDMWWSPWKWSRTGFTNLFKMFKVRDFFPTSELLCQPVNIAAFLFRIHRKWKLSCGALFKWTWVVQCTLPPLRSRMLWWHQVFWNGLLQEQHFWVGCPKLHLFIMLQLFGMQWSSQSHLLLWSHRNPNFTLFPLQLWSPTCFTSWNEMAKEPVEDLFWSYQFINPQFFDSSTVHFFPWVFLPSTRVNTCNLEI